MFNGYVSHYQRVDEQWSLDPYRHPSDENLSDLQEIEQQIGEEEHFPNAPAEPEPVEAGGVAACHFPSGNGLKLGYQMTHRNGHI